MGNEYQPKDSGVLTGWKTTDQVFHWPRVTDFVTHPLMGLTA